MYELVLTKHQPPALYLTTKSTYESVNRKWTEQSREIHEFMSDISQGLPVKHACASSGLNYNTVCQWLNERTAIYDPKFDEAFGKAHAHAVKRNIKRINNSRDWKAAAFWLERNTPEFAPKSLHRHETHDGVDNESNKPREMSHQQLSKLSAAHERMMSKLSDRTNAKSKDT